MRLPKERLAELLVEMQDQVRIETIEVPIPSPSPSPYIPWTVPNGPIVTYLSGDAANGVN